jgi:hypothetical protein
MSTDQPTLEDSVPSPHEQFLAGLGAQYGRPPSDAESAAESARSAMRCQCGEDIRQWADSPADARRWARVYGDENGVVPACPDCVSYRDNNGESLDYVPHAVREMDATSSIKRRDRREIALEHYRDGGR